MTVTSKQLAANCRNAPPPRWQNSQPLETPTDHLLVQGMRTATADVAGDAEVVGVPYNTDASHFSAAGIPCVVFGPADIAQAHSVTEFVEIEQVEAAVEILKRFLLEGAGSLG